VGARDDNDAVPIGDDDVAGLNEDTAADDRTVDGFDFVSARPNAPARFPEVKRDLFSGSRQKSRRSNLQSTVRWLIYWGKLLIILVDLVHCAGGLGT